MTLHTKNIGYWYTNNPDDYLFKDINKLGLSDYRKNAVSTIFQAYNLMTYMTARQNVQTALEITNTTVDNAKIEELFDLVGIPKEMIDKPVLQLSDGQ